ncbi:MAG: DUF1902 domain-containing protein [Methylococcales bacterium]
MTPKNIKCYAEKQAGYWAAVCLDFNLAAQDDSLDEVKTKLEVMIRDFIYDALVGEDKPYAAQLLLRHAQLSFWAKYYLIRLRLALNLTDGNQAFWDVTF